MIAQVQRLLSAEWSPSEFLDSLERDFPLNPVPDAVLHRQLDRFQWPDIWEAQQVVTVRETDQSGSSR